ncbi:MAG: DNA mismatch repair endonuclease MutL [Planctomycetia bacterium]|nr:DNA mismatch repair endonuclease MutL [Planctomycetia bacterium]
MAVIRELSTSMINLIAAGEVIERPANVVKELLENSLDAGATRIDVEIVNSGFDVIRIIDNGCGIASDQLYAALAPHSTSKVSSADDLVKISTLGFRGEALASIAEITQLTLTSCASDASEGAQVVSSYGEKSKVVPVGRSVGTTIEAKNIFYNAPVRRKYMRSPATEFAHIQETVARIAIPSPQVAITLKHNDRVVYDLQATDDPKSRIREIYGSQVCDNLIAVNSSYRDITISGFVSLPQYSRKSTTMQYLFINGRYFRDKSLARALGQAYTGLLLQNQYPVAFLFITTPLDFVDVNVHPTKQEVRFLDGQAMYASLLNAIRGQFQKSDLVHRPSGEALQHAAEHSPQPQGSVVTAPRATESDQVSDDCDGSTIRFVPDVDPRDVQAAIDPGTLERSRRNATDWINDAASKRSSDRVAESADAPQDHDDNLARRMTFDQSNAELEEAARLRESQQNNALNKYQDRAPNYRSALGGAPEFQKYPPIHSDASRTSAPNAPQSRQDEESSQEPRSRVGTFGGRLDAQLQTPHAPLNEEEKLQALRELVRANNAEILRSNVPTSRQVARDSQNRPVVQVCARYLIMESRDGLAIVDQHALHERILFEKLKASLERGSVESQTLLTPEPIDLTPTERVFVLENRELFAKLGVQVEDFGGSTVLVRSYPAILSDQSPRDAFGAVFQELSKKRPNTEITDVIDFALKQMACKAAIKAGDHLRPDEVVELVTLAEAELNAHHCPHGRPSAIVLSCQEIDKLFKRT